MTENESSYGAKKLEILRWIRGQPSMPHDYIECYEQFIKNSKTKPSFSYFFKICSKNTGIRVIKTGGYFSNTNDAMLCVLQRIKNRIGAADVIAIDEKPFIYKKYVNKKCRVANRRKGKINPDSVPQYKKTSSYNYYILVAITVENGVINAYISTVPYNTTSFNVFIKELLTNLTTSTEKYI